MRSSGLQTPLKTLKDSCVCIGDYCGFINTASVMSKEMTEKTANDESEDGESSWDK